MIVSAYDEFLIFIYDIFLKKYKIQLLLILSVLPDTVNPCFTIRCGDINDDGAVFKWSVAHMQ